MNADKKLEIQISPFDRFKQLASNLVSIPKIKIIEEDKKERKQKKNRTRKKRGK